MKLGQIAQLLLVIVAALGVYGFVSTWKDAERRRLCSPLCGMRPNYAAQNRLAPDFELESLAGGKVSLSQYRGKVVILNFWTKTCPPCLEEMPSLVELALSTLSCAQVGENVDPAALPVETGVARRQLDRDLRSVGVDDVNLQQRR